MVAPNSLTATASAAFAIVVSCCLLVRLPLVRGTTMMGPWTWTVISIWSIASVEIVLGSGVGNSFPHWAIPLRFAAAVSVFCPGIAVLGAKRPQHLAWHFLVASLWIGLSLPAWELLLLRPGQPFDAQDSRWWCFPVLLLIALANYLPTRLWAAALTWSAAQATLLSVYVPLLSLSVADSRPVVFALALSASAAVLAALATRRPAATSALDRLWLDFRDIYGGLWALRLAERVNAASRASNWQVSLGWRGFGRHEDAAPESTIPANSHASERHFESLLRRFVSRQWIARRRGP